MQIIPMIIPYSEDKNTGFIANDLEQWLSIIFMRLHDSRMKGNTGKNHFLVPSNFRDTIKIDSN